MWTSAILVKPLFINSVLHITFIVHLATEKWGSVQILAEKS